MFIILNKYFEYILFTKEITDKINKIMRIYNKIAGVFIYECRY